MLADGDNNDYGQLDPCRRASSKRKIPACRGAPPERVPRGRPRHRWPPRPGPLVRNPFDTNGIHADGVVRSLPRRRHTLTGPPRPTKEHRMTRRQWLGLLSSLGLAGAAGRTARAAAPAAPTAPRIEPLLLTDAQWRQRLDTRAIRGAARRSTERAGTSRSTTRSARAPTIAPVAIWPCSRAT